MTALKSNIADLLLDHLETWVYQLTETARQQMSFEFYNAVSDSSSAFMAKSGSLRFNAYQCFIDRRLR